MRGSDEPVVSVIVVGFDGIAYLEDCFSSLFKQAGAPSFEVIYLDNASTDGSPEFVKSRFPQVQLLALDRNVGFDQGNNIALRHAKGKYVALLNQDTLVHEHWLSELVRVAETSPEIAACHPNMITHWCPEFERRELSAPISTVYVADFSRYGFITYHNLQGVVEPVDTLFLHTAGALIRRDVIDELGYLFEEEFGAYCEDMDLALRINGGGYRTVLVPTSVLYHYQSLDRSLSWRSIRKTIHITRNRFLTYFKNMNLTELTLFLPLILLGSPRKAGEFGLRGVRRLAYGVALVALTFVAFGEAVVASPQFFARRRDTLRRRTHGRFWLLRELLSR